MPDLNQLPVPQYQPNQPYHWEYDNLPLQTLAQRDDIINSEVDAHGAILRECNGTQGTLANRLAQSIDPNGDLIPAAVDQALHNIAEHTDGSKTVSGTELSDYIALGFPSLTNPVSFVRMLRSERDKLALIADEATNIKIQVETPSNIVLFEEGEVELAESASISWEVESPNKIKPVLKISTEFAHRHYYNIQPVEVSSYKIFSVASYPIEYNEDSLRVYINGIRLNSQYAVYYPSNPVGVWTLNKYTENNLLGTFELLYSITENDIITVDFDVSLD